MNEQSLFNDETNARHCTMIVLNSFCLYTWRSDERTTGISARNHF